MGPGRRLRRPFGSPIPSTAASRPRVSGIGQSRVPFLKPGPNPAWSNRLVGPGQATGAAAEAAEEADWIERARRGDAEAFRRLVERYQDRAHGVAFRILGSAADAEEVAQDAFVRVWRALPAFRGEARFSTWLHRIVVRRAYDAAARMRRTAAREESLEALVERRGVEPAGGAVIGAPPAGMPPGGPPGCAPEESGRSIEPLLRRLTDVQRAVVALYYYEDRSVEEVGRVLELPVNTVKTHLHRARAALRAAMRREEGSES